MVKVVEVAQLGASYHDYVDSEVDGIAWDHERDDALIILYVLPDEPTEAKVVQVGSPVKVKEMHTCQL